MNYLKDLSQNYYKNTQTWFQCDNDNIMCFHREMIGKGIIIHMIRRLWVSVKNYFWLCVRVGTACI